MTIHNALSGDPFAIDEFLCVDAARVLKRFTPSPIQTPWVSETNLSKLVFKILFISICHQFNWDFMQSALAQWLFPQPERRLDEIANTRYSDLSRLLCSYPKQERVRAKERSALLRNTARELRSQLQTGIIERFLEQAPTLDGVSGFYRWIAEFSAFQGDDLEKKSRVLAHDLYRENIVIFSDPENLRPAVEYHLLRLYLRSGRVYPIHPSIKDHLTVERSPSRPRLVRLLRSRVAEAMILTSRLSGIDVATLNYVEWQIARTICEPDGPHCTSSTGLGLPDDVQAISDHCPYSPYCSAFNNDAYGWYYEPQFNKAIY